MRVRREEPHPVAKQGLSAPTYCSSFSSADSLVSFEPSRRIAPGVVIGFGNPIVHDDGVGPEVLRRVSPEIQRLPSVEFIELPWGGLSLLEVIRGREWAVLVDCLVTGQHPPGTVRVLSENDVRGSVRLVSYHDLNYATVMKVGRALGWAMPETVILLGIEGRDVYEFGEGLTAEVDAAADRAARLIETFVWERIGREPVSHGRES